MPPRKVRVSYVKARVSPGKRKKKSKNFIPVLRKPEGLSPLARYLTENEDSGLPIAELIEQFQEYDCPHSVKDRVVTGHKEIFTCTECGLIEVKEVKK